MILKASQRGGGKQLALHLLKTEENEHVEVHEIRGFVSDDPVGALKEAYAVSRGTRCKQFLFSVSLNPPETESVGVDVFENAADRIEMKVGLTDHPRVIVFHEKEGRRHAHCVWSRIDADSMTAVNMSHFKAKLRDISRELYLENDWKMPRGLMNSEERDPRNFTLAEWQQAKRMGENARDLNSMVQDCWAVSDSSVAFEQALGERGLILAKGDRRGHVAVTPEGQVLSVARSLDRRAKEVRAKLGEPDALPSVDEAKVRQARDMSQAFDRHVKEARVQHSEQAALLDVRRMEMTAAHASEREHLDASQKARWAEETHQRQERFNKGLRGLWDALTGQRAKMLRQNQEETYAALQRDREQRDSLVEAQLRERQELQIEIRAERRRQAEILIELRQDRQRHRRTTDAAKPQETSKPDHPTIKPQSPQPTRQSDTRPFKKHVKPAAAQPQTKFVAQDNRFSDRLAAFRLAAEPQSMCDTPPERERFDRSDGSSLAPDQAPTPEDRLNKLRTGQTDSLPAIHRERHLDR